MASLKAIRARAFVAQLDLSLAGVCLACLSFVSFPLDDGDEREVARQLRAMTPFLWEDGLDVQAFTAVRAACERGIRDGPWALTELESRGPRSVVAREIVLRLADLLVRRERADRKLRGLAFPRLAAAPPEMN
ncbi:MAG TPA: hypothetical protein VLJ44_12995 [Gaiellaceae bacterium]|nr:hypothetical protein [Gaiellaceae bacterium]